jgi:hypothetical protein
MVLADLGRNYDYLIMFSLDASDAYSRWQELRVEIETPRYTVEKSV